MKASWFHTSGLYMAGTWLHANSCFNLTACGHGQARRETSHSFVLRAKGDLETKFFIATLGTVQLVSLDVCISIILPASGKRDASLRRWRYAVEAKLELSPLQNPLSTCSLLRRKFTRTQAQLHTLGVRSRPELAISCSCFPKPHALVSDLSKPRVVVRRYYARSTTWQQVVLVPRSTEAHVAKSMAISRNDLWSVDCTGMGTIMDKKLTNDGIGSTVKK